MIRRDAEVLRCRRTDLDRVSIEEDDPIVSLTDTDLTLATEHTEALYPTDLTLLDREGIIPVSQDCTDRRHDDALTSGDVRRTTDDL